MPRSSQSQSWGCSSLSDRKPHSVGDHVAYPLSDQVLALLAEHDSPPPAVDDLSLAVHHLVVLEDVLPDLEVLCLDLALGALDRLGNDPGLDGDIVGDTEPLHDPLDPLSLESAHQVVAQRQVEARLAGITLTTGAAAQLVVDPAALVPLGADDVEAAQIDDLVMGGLDLD